MRLFSFGPTTVALVFISSPAIGATLSTEKMNKYSDCLIEQISKLDDNISDASSIALAAAMPCRPLLYLAADQMSKEGGVISTKETYKVLMDDEAANVTAMVLQYRRSMQSSKNKQ